MREKSNINRQIDRCYHTYPDQCFNIVQCILCIQSCLSSKERHKTTPYNERTEKRAIYNIKDSFRPHEKNKSTRTNAHFTKYNRNKYSKNIKVKCNTQIICNACTNIQIWQRDDINLVAIDSKCSSGRDNFDKITDNVPEVQRKSTSARINPDFHAI